MSFIYCMTIKSLHGWFDVLKLLKKSLISVSIMKSILLSKSTFWLFFLYTVQKCKRKSLLVKVTLSCFHGSLLDDRLSQIPGQSESQELHFGHLDIFLLRWQKHTRGEVDCRSTICLHVTGWGFESVFKPCGQKRLPECFYSDSVSGIKAVRTCIPAWACLCCSARRWAPLSRASARRFDLLWRSPGKKKLLL